jgi:DNA sulfur modification protein DndD
VRIKNEAGGFAKLIEDDYKNYRNSMSILADKQADRKTVIEIISKSRDIDIKKLEVDYLENTRKIDEKDKKRIELSAQKIICNSNIDTIQKKIDSLIVTSEKNDRIKRYIQYSNELFEWFDRIYQNNEKAVKESILDSVNTIFKKIYHGKRSVIINDNYQIALSAQVGDTQRLTDESKGLETVKNFSFIIGLIDIARKQIQNTEEIGPGENLKMSIEPYPLIMDAPFSNADEKHIESISRIIPKIAEQVILIVMNKDWEFSRKALEEKVGEYYIIEKVNNSETYSVIKGGNKYV